MKVHYIGLPFGPKGKSQYMIVGSFALVLLFSHRWIYYVRNNEKNNFK